MREPRNERTPRCRKLADAFPRAELGLPIDVPVPGTRRATLTTSNRADGADGQPVDPEAVWPTTQAVPIIVPLLAVHHQVNFIRR
jgi:hypothetical protein